MPPTIQSIVNRQIAKTLRKGDRLGKFDQIRQRYFWSTYLFLGDPLTNKVSAGTYDIFKAVPGAAGQGYPTNVNLTLRETNWLNQGRVPDNQSFAITEIGATIRTPPLENPTAPSANGVYSALTLAQQNYVKPGVARGLMAQDAYNIANSTILEMSFLTNNVPLGLLIDFSQAGGIISPPGSHIPNDASAGLGLSNPTLGIPSAAFRRKLQVPILLSGGENMGMRLNVPRDIDLISPAAGGDSGPGGGGKGWYEVRIDWWAIESFVEKS